jgi:predicted RecB family nuclease
MKEAEAFQKDIPRFLRQQWDVLQQEKPPDIAPGAQCKSPYECEFYQLCNPILPGDHVSFLPGLRQNRKQELLDRGIVSIKDIPATFPLTDLQRRVRDCVCSGVPCFSGQIASELAELRYPLFFTDFETFNPAIPRFAGMRPYGAFPFQWSVHIQSRPGANLEHHEFLACDGTDPREAFISSLLAILEKNAGGQVVCYSKYEATQLAGLARWLPGYARRIEKVQGRVWDILAFIRKHVYHPNFGGSFSLKQVLPALVPDMTYADMPVADGTEAGLAYDTLVRGSLPETERLELRRALLAYCAQDTLAMTKVLEVVRSS